MIATRISGLKERTEFPAVDGSAASGNMLEFRVVTNDAGLQRFPLGLSRNISFGGICFTTDVPVELDDCVALRVRLPEFGNTPIDALGSIIRKHKKGERSEIAVKFLWIGCEEKLQKTLKEFVQKKITR